MRVLRLAGSECDELDSSKAYNANVSCRCVDAKETGGRLTIKRIGERLCQSGEPSEEWPVIEVGQTGSGVTL